MPITRVVARQIFDSRGNPTVEVDVTTEKGNILFLVFHIYIKYVCSIP